MTQAVTFMTPIWTCKQVQVTIWETRPNPMDDTAWIR